MSVLEQFYDVSPVKAIDQNKWDLKLAEVQMQFQGGGFYTPLLEWREHTDAQTVWETEMIEGDTDAEEIPMTANYIDAEMPVDSRMRRWNVAAYAGKVQMHESENYFQQFVMSGSKDWRITLDDVRAVAKWGAMPNQKRISGDSVVLLPHSLHSENGDAQPVLRDGPALPIALLVSRIKKGVGPTYLTKILRFVLPQEYGALDSCSETKKLDTKSTFKTQYVSGRPAVHATGSRTRQG